MTDEEEAQGQTAGQIPSEYFQRTNKTAKYQLKTTIECEPRIGFSSYLEKLLSPIVTLRHMETFSVIEILANYPSSSDPGNLIINAFYHRDDPNKKSYSFGANYTNVVTLKRDFENLAEKIKKGYPKSCVYFARIKRIKPLNSKS